MRLKPGGLSGVIKENDGLHIIKMIQRKPSRQLSFEEARPLIESELRTSLSEKRKQEWEQQLKQNAKIEIEIMITNKAKGKIGNAQKGNRAQKNDISKRRSLPAVDLTCSVK